MPRKEETIEEKLKRLSIESDINWYQDRKDRQDREKEIKLKEIERDIASIRAKAEVNKNREGNASIAGKIIKKLVLLPVMLLLIPVLYYCILQGKQLPKQISSYFE